MNTAINVDYRIDAFTVLQDPDVPYALLPAYDGGDHLHMTTAGYDTLGANIYRGVTWTGLRR